MRVLYAALEQTIPGTTGGSVHVESFAAGLQRLGHEVHALVTPGAAPLPDCGVTWHALPPPLGRRQLRLLRSGAVLALARRLRPDVIIERYYNFGGEAILAARKVSALAVLEVNAPVIDHAGSAKQRLDRLALVEPMRRWREWQCRAADLIITPTAAILPGWVPSARVLEIEWGADTERFRPDVTGPVPFERKRDHVVAVFAGAFRPWHGAIDLVRAVGRLHAGGAGQVDAVLIGDGPELPRVRRAAQRVDGVTCIGAVPHQHVPACLAAADIGVAPFDVDAHGPLALEFYWSPLKVFEYMASGLPVVAPAIERLQRVVRDGEEGVLYDASRPESLDRALLRLCDDSLRASLGRNARARVLEQFGWDRHCRIVVDRLEQLRCGSVSRDPPPGHRA
jgi:glycosyltransferase involved in cell wall biosynthesis